MIVIDKRQLKFLLNGRTLTISPIKNGGKYRKDRDYALGLNHRRQICRVRIIHAGDDYLVIALHHADQPRLLAAHSEHGYTNDPHRAMRHEPEAMDPMAEHAPLRWAQERAKREAERQLTTLHERLLILERHYAAGETQLEPDLRVIRSRIQAIRNPAPKLLDDKNVD